MVRAIKAKVINSSKKKSKEFQLSEIIFEIENKEWIGKNIKK